MKKLLILILSILINTDQNINTIIKDNIINEINSQIHIDNNVNENTNTNINDNYLNYSDYSDYIQDERYPFIVSYDAYSYQVEQVKDMFSQMPYFLQNIIINSGYTIYVTKDKFYSDRYDSLLLGVTKYEENAIYIYGGRPETVFHECMHYIKMYELNMFETTMFKNAYEEELYQFAAFYGTTDEGLFNVSEYICDVFEAYMCDYYGLRANCPLSFELIDNCLKGNILINIPITGKITLSKSDLYHYDTIILDNNMTEYPDYFINTYPAYCIKQIIYNGKSYTNLNNLITDMKNDGITITENAFILAMRN